MSTMDLKSLKFWSIWSQIPEFYGGDRVSEKESMKVLF